MRVLKTITLIVTICCSLSVLSQELEILNPEIRETVDFSAEAEARWQKRVRQLSVEDKELLEKYSEVISGMWYWRVHYL